MGDADSKNLVREILLWESLGMSSALLFCRVCKNRSRQVISQEPWLGHLLACGECAVRDAVPKAYILSGLMFFMCERHDAREAARLSWGAQ